MANIIADDFYLAKTLANIAALKAEPSTALIQYVRANAGNRQYYWDSTSPAVPNDITVIKPTDVVGNGRWLLYEFQQPTHIDTIAPTVNDDYAAGFRNGDFWADTVTDFVYICKDNTTGAAIWIQTNEDELWQLISNTVSPKLLSHKIASGITAAGQRIHANEDSATSCFLQATNSITGVATYNGTRIGIQSDGKGNIISQLDLLFRTTNGSTYRGKIDALTGNIEWANDIGISRAGDCKLKLNNTELAGKEWHIINQTGGGWPLLFKNITDNKIIASFNPAAPEDSFTIDLQGFIGLGTNVFTATSKIRVFEGINDLLEIKTDGTVLSKVADYTPLVTSNNVLINKGYFDGNLPVAGLFQEGAGFVSPITTTNSVNVASGESYFVNSVDINDSPTLPNIAYLDYANVFSVDQEIKKTAIIEEAKLKLTAAAGGGCVIEADVNSGSTSSAEMSISSGWIAFARKGESFTSNDIFRIDVINRGVSRYISNEVVVTTGTYNSIDISVYNTILFNTVGGAIIWNGVANGINKQRNITYSKSHYSNSLTIVSQSASATQQLRTGAAGAAPVIYGANGWGFGTCGFIGSHLYVGPAR